MFTRTSPGTPSPRTPGPLRPVPRPRPCSAPRGSSRPRRSPSGPRPSCAILHLDRGPRRRFCRRTRPGSFPSPRPASRPWPSTASPAFRRPTCNPCRARRSCSAARRGRRGAPSILLDKEDCGRRSSCCEKRHNDHAPRDAVALLGALLSRHSCKLALRKCQILSRRDPLLCLMVMLVMMKRHALPAGPYMCLNRASRVWLALR